MVIKLSSDATNYYRDFISGRYKYVVFRIDIFKDEPVVEVDTTGVIGDTYGRLLSRIKSEFSTQCRFTLFYYKPGELNNEKITVCSGPRVMMLWSPSGATEWQKMMYSSNYDALKKALFGVSKYVQATDEVSASELVISSIVNANRHVDLFEPTTEEENSFRDNLKG